ncbi:MAG: nitronate monooxygenase [Sphingobium sp.]
MTAQALLASLRIPLMQAPMSIASTDRLALACAKAGVMGCFPTHNAQRADGLRPWIERLTAQLKTFEDEGGRPAPFAVNINVSRRKAPELLAEELAACRDHRVPVVTTNVGDPAQVVRQVHEWGGLVIHDATTVEQAERAAAAGVDGLMLVCAGAGGLGGTLTPFAFLPRVRRFFSGIVQLAGGVADGRGIAAARMLGADMVCMGTRFIATRESGVVEGHKAMLADADIGDLLWTDAICGVNANFLRPSIRANGLDPDALPPPQGGRTAIPREVKPWSMIWSGGQSVGGIDDIPAVADLVERLETEYRTALAKGAA